MRRHEMDQLIEEHLAAEKAGDPKACVAAYTADVIHDVVGMPNAVIRGPEAATVPGELMGIPGNNREISFRILHVWEFRDGAMSRENVWLDSGAIIEQLTTSEPAALMNASGT
jgi:hypothetical protein